MAWQRAFLAVRALSGETPRHDELRLDTHGAAFVSELAAQRGRARRAALIARELSFAAQDLAALRYDQEPRL